MKEWFKVVVENKRNCFRYAEEMTVEEIEQFRRKMWYFEILSIERLGLSEV